MSVTNSLRGVGFYTPSWTQSCNGNPSINEILDQIDLGAIENANNTVKDFHIDFGLGADQVNTDDIPEGVTNLYYSNSLVEAFLGFGNAGDFLVTNPTEDGYIWSVSLAGNRVSLDTTNFNKNLSPADSDVQTALETINNLDIGGVSFSVSQTAHGFSNLSPVYHDGSEWQPACADNETTLATHVITEIVDVNNFVVSQVGRIIVTAHGLTIGNYYYTSELSPGTLTTVEGNIFSNPMLYVLDANALILLGFRASGGIYTDTNLHSGRVIKSGTQSVVSSGTVQVTGWSVDFANGITWDAANNRFQVVRAGYYTVLAQLEYANTVAGELLQLSVNVNNGADMRSQVSASTNGTPYGILFRHFNAGDTIQADTYIVTGANRVIQAGDNTFISIVEHPQSVAFKAVNSNKLQNAILNGNFDVWQRGSTFTTPNSLLYHADHWYQQQETSAAWTLVRDTDVPDGSLYALKATNVTLNNQLALVHQIESVDAIKLRNKKVTLSFQAKTTSLEISKLKATVLSWTGTADAPTAAVISSWASDGTDPTFAANYTKEVVGADCALSNSYQRFIIPNINLDTASFNNLAVVIWVDDGTIAAGDDFWITQVQLNEGEDYIDFIAPVVAEEVAKCKRYYEKSYNYPIVPGTNTLEGAYWCQGTTNGSGDFVGYFNFLVEKRAIPTMTYWRPDGTAGSWTYARSGASGNATPVDSRSNPARTSHAPYFAGGANWVAITVQGHWQAVSELT